MTKKCPECGVEMDVCKMPVWFFDIPFTKLEVWRQEKVEYCLECVIEAQRPEPSTFF